jgi:hypothetical protein
LKYLGWAAHIARTAVPWAITACTVAAQFMANPSKLHFALVPPHVDFQFYLRNYSRSRKRTYAHAGFCCAWSLSWRRRRRVRGCQNPAG